MTLSLLHAYNETGLLVFALITLGCSFLIKPPQTTASGRERLPINYSPTRPTIWIGLLCGSVVVAFTVLGWLLFPVGDTYHWSMFYYWRQHETILPFFVHNTRITDIAFLPHAAYYPFFVFLNSARFVVIWNAFLYVFAGVLAYHCCRKWPFPPRIALLTVLLVFGSTLFAMLVAGYHFTHALWVVLALGALYFLIEARQATSDAELRRALLASAFLFALSVGCKNVAIFGLPFYALGLLWLFKDRLNVKVVTKLAAVGLAGLLLGGVFWNYTMNVYQHGTLSGDQFDKSPTEQSWRAFWTRNLRGLTCFADVTPIPLGRFGGTPATWNRTLVRALGGAAYLEGEEKGQYYSYDGDVQGMGMGLTGLAVLLPAMVVTAAGKSIRNREFLFLLIFFWGGFMLLHGLLFWGRDGRFRLLHGFIIWLLPVVAAFLNRGRLRQSVAVVLVMLSLGYIGAQQSAFALRLHHEAWPILARRELFYAYLYKYARDVRIVESGESRQVTLLYPASGELYRHIDQLDRIRNQAVAYVAGMNSMDFTFMADHGAELVPVPDLAFAIGYPYAIWEEVDQGEYRVPGGWTEVVRVEAGEKIMLALLEREEADDLGQRL